MKLQKKKKNITFEKEKKKQANLNESLKPGLISQTHNPLYPRPKLSQESQISTNLILKNKTEKKINLKSFPKQKSSNKKNKNKM